MQTKFNFRTLSLLLAGFLVSFTALAQTIVVKGHVQDTSGEPVSFGSVVVKGTTNGCNTDINGNFTLKCQKGATVQFSYVGYKTTTAAASDQMLVVMEDVSNSLNEAVVIGYGVAKKNDLTGSVVAIKPDEKNHGLITNAQEMIQGKIAGVSVTTGSGKPGDGASIKIRGGSSLSASNDPLIVIDGLPMDNDARKGSSNPLASINPNDIETFTVLKDASATAIYGSRGSNGVIIITTKKGRTSTPAKVTYNGNWGISKQIAMLDLMDANEYRSFIKNYYGEASEAYGLLGNANTDWQKEIYQNAITHEHNITVTGGLKHMPYRVSLGYLDQEGVIKTSEYERYTGGVSLNPSLAKDHLTFNINGKYMLSNTRKNADVVGAARWWDPTQPVRNDAPEYAHFGGYQQWIVPSTEGLGDPTWPYFKNTQAQGNPVSSLNLTDNHGRSNALIGNIEADYKIHGLEDLRIHMNAAGEYDWGRDDSYVSPYSFSNLYNGWDGWNSEKRFNLTYTAYLQYYKDFNENHHFDIMGGYEWSHKKYWGREKGQGWYPNTNTNLDADGNAQAGQPYNYNFHKWRGESYLVSFFGRAGYTLMDRYLFTATVRYDGSSRFAKGHKWGLFPSAAFAWRIKDEKWLKDVDFVSELKLRLGYGQTGQQDGIDNYIAYPKYQVSNPNATGTLYPITGTNGILYAPLVYNPNLTWETTTTYNAGIDFGIIKGKLFGSVDYYYRKTTDLINTVYVAAGSNFKNQMLGNVGSLVNQGAELSLTYRPIQKNNWMWEITGNVTYNHNEITETAGGQMIPTGPTIGGGSGNVAAYHAQGHPAGSYYVYQQVYDQNGMPLEGVYVDRDGNGIINELDRYFYKSPAHPWLVGLSTRLQYKNWDLGLGFHGSFGGYLFNQCEQGFCNIDKTYDSSFGLTHNILKSSAEMGWTTYDNNTSDYFVQNASFFRLDNITLGYSFDHLFKGGKYEGASGRIYAAASNIYTFTKYKGLDPEVNGGFDSNMYPRPFTFQIGLNLNF